MASALLYDRSIGAKRIVRNLQGERRALLLASVGRARNGRTIRRKERP
jgi:hypothetical protein